MEYMFGTIQRNNKFVETVRIKSSAAESITEISSTTLSGKIEIERKFEDNIITDNFVVVEHYHSSEDSEGNIYNWYIIRDHNRYIDKFTPSIKKTEQEITDLEIEVIELKLEIAELKEQLIEQLNFIISDESDESEDNKSIDK